MSVVIVDYGTGNIFSIEKCLARIGVKATVSSSADHIRNAEKIILPGVGHFRQAMKTLIDLGLIDELNNAVMVERTPVLGICLGMELMAKSSEEGNAKGLGWIDGDVVRFSIADKERFKVPHIGWNHVSVKKNSSLMRELTDRSEFYFLHSFYLECNDKADVLSETEYESVFTSSIEKGNIFGVQFHPEKSHDAGVQLLKNFIEM
jgi:imidazole glycerol phosphate synthase, glutamine amidotransferase subunit